MYSCKFWPIIEYYLLWYRKFSEFILQEGRRKTREAGGGEDFPLNLSAASVGDEAAMLAEHLESEFADGAASYYVKVRQRVSLTHFEFTGADIEDCNERLTVSKI